MSNEAWNTAVATFRSVIDNVASDDRAIRQAWMALRQNYGERFNAKIVPHIGAQQNAQQNVEPFSLWAAEHLNGDVLERVLRVVFSKELSQCDHLTLLRSTASLADTTMWHLLLYFGVTVFSEHLFGHIRKRVRVFEKDSVNGTWAFVDAYTRVLQQAAQRQKIVLDSTTIPCPTAGRVFTKPDLTVLASANPEFDKPSQRKPAASMGNSRVQEAAPATAATNTEKPDAINTAGDSIADSEETVPKASVPSQRREEPLPSGSNAHNVGPPHIEPEPQHRQSVAARRNPRREARAGHSAIPQILNPKLEYADDVDVKKESPPRAQRDQSMVTGQQPRELSTIYVRTGALQRSPSKRPVEEKAGEASTANNDRVKRANNTASRSALLEENQDWDDDTTFHVLKHLAAMCPGEWTVIDGMRENSTNRLIQLKGEDGEKGSLLVSLKLEDGQRLLVVVNLKPSYNSNSSKQGVMRYYDPAGSPYMDSAARNRPTARLAPVLSHVLPDRDLDPEEWETKYCVCPKLVSEKDSGLAVCLAAIYAVGSCPLPEKWDWGFWRYIVLGGFFPDDGAVQIHVGHYREGIIRMLIRQGKMSDGFLSHVGRGTSPDEIEYLGTTTMNPVERIEWREENSKKIVTAIHEGLKVFQALQEHIDMGKASFKAQLDKHAYIQKDLRQKLEPANAAAPPVKVEQDGQSEESFNMTTLQQATKEHALCQGYLKGLEAADSCVQKALYGLKTWRRLVNEAVAEDDESLLIRSVE
ncbi:hypothetical protein VMCG_01456 [Cytospora schulzeri]|uniref:Uncharacterized protein n=1 Tax=Cytospora schulzeri TaxID=448051 RepID=A0A423X6X7_9PEZI|nr:hypothetical protein VMCG_01456 [Valsa malicola]